jgi:hypothetical protein
VTSPRPASLSLTAPRRSYNRTLAITAQVLEYVYQPTSGSAVSRYDPAVPHNRQGWVIYYQNGNLVNLVHELTHAVTHQQYETDGITYASNKAVTARTYTSGFPCAGRNLAYCDNEELRQKQFRDEAAERWMTDNTNRLYRWAKQFGLAPAQLNMKQGYLKNKWKLRKNSLLIHCVVITHFPLFDLRCIMGHG